MFESRKGLGITFIGLLFISNALSYCVWTEDQSEYAINTYSECSQSTDDLWLPAGSAANSIDKISLTKIANVRAAVKKLKILSENYPIFFIKFTESNLTELPSELLALADLQNLEVTHQNIPIINLNILYNAKDLYSLNVSHNGIKEFEIEPTTYASTKKLLSIDLSYNKFDLVPDNSFYGTRNSLEYLDLSHNEISSINFYAFSSMLLLKTLRLSNNKLVHLGLVFYPIRNLRHLYLDHNQIKNIHEETFAKSTSLINLDVSFNNIEMIDDRAFGPLTDLINLNLGSNNIHSIKEILLRNNSLLETLNLSFNNLSYVEPGMFSVMNNLVHIDLEGVYATALQSHVLTGLKVKALSFSGSTIDRIPDSPFISMGNYLQSLNLSSCGIHTISETAFDTLNKLTELDLSDNKLTEITFQTTDLENLSKLNLRNNLLSVLKPETFQHLQSLTELDLSNNVIHNMPAMLFKNQKRLELFKILDNKLDTIIQSNTFFGLENIQELELRNTKVVRWDSYALSGLNNLKVLNASHGMLAYIDYYAFTGTGNIEILDLSYNEIQQFNVKLLPNKNMRRIHLNNNQLGNILNNTFDGFDVLNFLDLSNNNLVAVDSSAFSYLKSLRHLDLSHNVDIELNGNVFENLFLDTLLLKNTSDNISFECENVTITNLDLSSSRISNVSLLQLHKIKRLFYLDLSQNNISVLNQFSFADGMQTLDTLDLSLNNIAHINPGTFLNLNSVGHLDLSYNKLDKIQFGALRGFNKLHTLNLSNNDLTNFKLTLLYNLPPVLTIYLDNNKISRLGFANKYLINLSSVTLSIGGNNILCDDLVYLTMRDAFIITAASLDYFSENIDGVSCTSNSIYDESIPDFVIE